MHKELPPGASLAGGRYVLETILGHGGFGITYRGTDAHTSAKVAVKEMFLSKFMRRSEDGRSVQFPEAFAPDVEREKARLMSEAKTLATLEDRCFVRVNDWFEENNTAYLVMEYVEGRRFSDLLRAMAPMDYRVLCELLLPLLDALDRLHQQHVVHMDIAPDNLILCQGSGGEYLRLIDFGSSSSGTEAGGTVKPGYSPPEQYAGENIGPWTDLYALSALMYEALTGVKPPSSGERALLADQLQPASSIRPEIPHLLSAIIAKGMALAVEDRWQSVAEMAKELRSCVGEKKPGDGKETPKKGRWPLAALAVCLLAVLLTVGFFVVPSAIKTYRQAHMFDNIETETVYFYPADDMKHADYKIQLETFRGLFVTLADGRPIRFEEHENGWLVTTALEVYTAQENGSSLDSQLDRILADSGLSSWMYIAEIPTDWMGKDNIYGMGQHQVTKDEIPYPCVEVLYSCQQPLDNYAYMKTISDTQTRLDAIGIPYAIGVYRGDEQSIVIRVAAKNTCPAMMNTLMANWMSAGIHTNWESDGTIRLSHCEDAAIDGDYLVLRWPYNSEWEQEAWTKLLNMTQDDNLVYISVGSRYREQGDSYFYDINYPLLELDHVDETQHTAYFRCCGDTTDSNRWALPFAATFQTTDLFYLPNVKDSDFLRTGAVLYDADRKITEGNNEYWGFTARSPYSDVLDIMQAVKDNMSDLEPRLHFGYLFTEHGISIQVAIAPDRNDNPDYILTLFHEIWDIIRQSGKSIDSVALCYPWHQGETYTPIRISITQESHERDYLAAMLFYTGSDYTDEEFEAWDQAVEHHEWIYTLLQKYYSGH